jgi:hypothetical protein
LDFDTLSTGDAADIIGQLKERLESEPFGDVEPVSGVQPVLEPPTPVDRGEPVTEPVGPSEGNPSYIARVEMMKKPGLLEEAAARGLDTAGTAQDLRARIIADVS